MRLEALLLGMTVCSKCGVCLTVSNTYLSKKKLRRVCKECSKAESREYRRRDKEAHKERVRAWCRANPERVRYLRNRWNRANPEKVYATQIKIKYGLSYEEYKRMLEQQKGRCLICNKTPGRRRLAIDHDHDTGQVRSLLCGTCNLILGRTGEDAEYLRKIALYAEGKLYPVCDNSVL